MDVSLWVGIVGAVFGVAGIIQTYRFYVKSRKVRLLAWDVQSISDGLTASTSHHQGSESIVRIRNLGNETITKEMTRESLRIWARGDAQIESVDILEAKPVSQVVVQVVESCAEVVFESLAPDEYVTLRVEHSGLAAQLEVTGEFRDTAPLRKIPDEQLKALVPGMSILIYGQTQRIVSAASITQQPLPLAEPTRAEQLEDRKSHISDTDLRALFAARALEITLTDTRGSEDPVNESWLGAVNFALQNAEVYVLGEPAGDVSTPGQGTESDLLHFTVDLNENKDAVMLPVFSSPDMMRTSLLREPQWGSLSILQVEGKALLENRDPDVHIVVNPWTRLEARIPARKPPEARSSAEGVS